ncbi:SurA N-terminal domain-containing protein [Neomegalonema sp.]|uniref:SurA N-terminal domain-containing protein n=1 Tax=Neomegalonema sp. TaxID=2039713 RepID=UPI00261030BC|nr:SurA N-terminal domain-containing protein [Neomegalonema sp.]MDD2869838.1 SurA N-terminal domain-containing protein [Neomegalonema sp.]
MLEALRKSAGSLVGKLILGLLVVAFAVWGITDVLMGNAGTTAARVSGKEITTQQYAREFSALARSLRLTAEDARNIGVDRMALDRLAAGVAMDAQAESFGLVAGDAQVTRDIAADPSFAGATGGFSQTNYVAVLRRIGMQPQDYEAGVRSRLTQEMLLQAAAGGAAPPRSAVEALEIHENERRAAQYLLFSYAEAPEPEAPSEETLKAFHEAEASLFTTPELRAGDWVQLSAATLAKPGDLTEAEIRAAYDAAIARFSTPESRRVEQVLFEDEASARAAALRVKEGETLMQVAASLGRSPGEVQLGWTTRDRLPADLGAAVFGLEGPGLAEPYAGGFGWTLAGATEVRPASVTPFEEVRERLAAEIAADRARARLPQAILDMEDYIAGGSTLAEVAGRLGLEDHRISETDAGGFDARGLSAENLPPNFPGFLEALFAARPGAAPTRLDGPGGDASVYFLQASASTPAALKPFESVREEVLRAWTDRQKRDAVAARAKSAVERIAGGESLLEVSADLGTTVQEAPLFGRRETPLDLGAEAVSRLFLAAEGAPVEAAARDDAGRLAAVVVEIRDPSAEEVAANVETRLTQYAEQLRRDLEQALIAETLRQGDLRVYPEAMAAVSQSLY